jgi:hypothetical protein
MECTSVGFIFLVKKDSAHFSFLPKVEATLTAVVPAGSPRIAARSLI